MRAVPHRRREIARCRPSPTGGARWRPVADGQMRAGMRRRREVIATEPGVKREVVLERRQIELAEAARRSAARGRQVRRACALDDREIAEATPRERREIGGAALGRGQVERSRSPPRARRGRAAGFADGRSREPKLLANPGAAPAGGAIGAGGAMPRAFADGRSIEPKPPPPAVGGGGTAGRSTSKLNGFAAAGAGIGGAIGAAIGGGPAGFAPSFEGVAFIAGSPASPASAGRSRSSRPPNATCGGPRAQAAGGGGIGGAAGFAAWRAGLRRGRLHRGEPDVAEIEIGRHGRRPAAAGGGRRRARLRGETDHRRLFRRRGLHRRQVDAARRGGCRRRRALRRIQDEERVPALRATHLQAGRRYAPLVDLIGRFAGLALDLQHVTQEAITGRYDVVKAGSPCLPHH